MSIQGDKDLLTASGMCFNEEQICLNMNDVWMWGCSDGEDVPDEDVAEVARLFRSYGFCGLLYWVSERRELEKSEFHDNNRFIEFVRHEEELRKQEPRSSKRAYMKISYTLGG
jgi:hypothetical protein